MSVSSTGRSTSRDGARRSPVRSSLPSGRAGRLPGRIGAGPGRVLSGRLGRRVRPAGGPPGERAAELPRDALRSREAGGCARRRVLRRRVRGTR